MAKQKGNVVTHGLRGKIGDLLVFRQTAAGTVVSKMPAASGKVSAAQLAHRRKFQRAVIYGQAAMEDPAAREGYEAAAKRKKRAALQVAVADFLHAPDIEAIDLSAYHGLPGDVIKIVATDDFAVREVKVVIYSADGSVVEEGLAAQGAAGYEWIYTATAANPNLQGDRIEVFASDTPGNISKREEIM